MREEPPAARPALLLPDLSERRSGQRARLDRDETRHARALRLDDGAVVALVDGRGSRREGRLGPGTEREREVTVGESLPVPEPLPVELCVAVGNRTHALWLIEKAAEFGAVRIRLLETERSRSVADAGRSDAFREKAERRALAAMKQSGGAWAPVVEPPLELAEWLAGGGARRGILLDPEGPALSAVLASWNGRDRLPVVTGPEGGLSARERRACLEAGLRPARLASTILRFETAALAALAVAWQRRETAGSGAAVLTSDGGER